MELEIKLGPSSVGSCKVEVSENEIIADPKINFANLPRACPNTDGGEARRLTEEIAIHTGDNLHHRRSEQGSSIFNAVGKHTSVRQLERLIVEDVRPSSFHSSGAL